MTLIICMCKLYMLTRKQYLGRLHTGPQLVSLDCWTYHRSCQDLLLMLTITNTPAAGTGGHKPSGRLALLSVRPAVIFPAAEHHCPLASTKLYCLVTEAQ